MQTPSGSPYYIAPEVFQQRYDNKCDMWSMGVVLYILLSGKVPFPGESNKEIIENVLKGEYHFNHDAFKKVTDGAKDLISKLLVKDPNKRFSAEDAYNHPWIQSSVNPDQPVSEDVYANMKNFIEAVKLKKTILTYLASKLPEKPLEDLRASFISIDKNGDGRIQEKEFKGVLESQGVKATPEELKELMNVLDTNQNGYIDYTEFLAGCMRSKIYLNEDNLRTAFEYFDKNQDGMITLKELTEVLSKDDLIPEDEVRKMISEVDVNKDDQIDYNEFLMMMKKGLA